MERDPRCSPRGNPACRGQTSLSIRKLTVHILRKPGLGTFEHDSTLGESSREAQSGRRLLGTNGGSLWLWCCLAQAGALGP